MMCIKWVTVCVTDHSLSAAEAKLCVQSLTDLRHVSLALWLVEAMHPQPSRSTVICHAGDHHVSAFQHNIALFLLLLAYPDHHAINICVCFLPNILYCQTFISDLFAQYCHFKAAKLLHFLLWYTVDRFFICHTLIVF